MARSYPLVLNGLFFFSDYYKLPTKGQPKMVGKEMKEEKEVWANGKS